MNNKLIIIWLFLNFCGSLLSIVTIFIKGFVIFFALLAIFYAILLGYAFRLEFSETKNICCAKNNKKDEILE